MPRCQTVVFLIVYLCYEHIPSVPCAFYRACCLKPKCFIPLFSSHKHNNGQPMWFTLGIREAIKGWDRGLKDMCVGEKRKLTIPPALAYGKEGKGKTPEVLPLL